MHLTEMCQRFKATQLDCALVKRLIAALYADIKQPARRKTLGVIVRGPVFLFPTDHEIVYSSAAISV